MNKDNFAASIRNAEVGGLNTGAASVAKLSSLLSGNEASVEGCLLYTSPSPRDAS